ncbi:MAG: hypothetical protein K2N25_04745 [Muribaculaceae bacterium]|nr:hypothetical protein [Muribaculaceae bacterium]
MTMDKKEIYKRIDLYFEAMLSRHEERQLLAELLPLEGRDRRIDEALAVMLASRFAAPVVTPVKRRPMKLIAGVAASIAVVVAASLIFYHPRDTQTFAYVSGMKIQDPAEINDIIATQLSDIGESTDLFSQTLSEDFDDIREALNDDDL